MDKDVVVYWAPVFFDPKSDWNMMYFDLPSVQDYIRPSMVKNEPNQNFFYCPAFSNAVKNTFLLINPIESHFIFNGTEVGVKSKNYIELSIKHKPSIEGNLLFEYGMQYVFFTEEDVSLTLTSPFFNKANHLKYGALVPGKLKINSWFRTINLEYNLWKDNNEFILEKDEVMGYVSFETEKKVKLVRFQMNETLHKYINSCGTSSRWEQFVPLADRYKRFMRSRMNEIVLKEIKKNLV